MKRFMFISILLLGYLITKAQTAALSFVNPTITGNKFRITLRMASVGGNFGLGGNNLHFNYSTASLSNPVLVAENFPTAFGATTTTGTNIVAGHVSINTSYLTSTPANLNALPITAAGVDLATVEFTVLNLTSTASFSWRITGANPKVALADDDKLTVRTVSSAPNLTNVGFYYPTNAGADVNFYCNTNSVTLTASGGTGGYVWSTGQTATSINVSPTVTSTYSVTSTDGTRDEVTVIKTNAVTLGADKTVNCINPTTTLTAHCGGSGYTWNTGETTASIIINPSITSIYSVTASDGTSDNMIVYVDKIVPVANAGADVTINCTTGAKNISASGGVSYVWSNGVVLNSFSAAPTITTTYTVTVTATSGCTSTDQVTVFVDKIASTANAGPDASVNCYNPSVTLMGSGTGTSISYSWLSINGSQASYTATNTVSPQTTTTYTLIVKGSNGCIASDVVTVFADKTPPYITTTPHVVVPCGVTADITLTATASSAATYLWGNGSTLNTIMVSPTIATTYDVRAKKISNGCQTIGYISVESDCLPKLSLAAKVFLNHVDPVTKLMDNYISTLSDFPLTDPYTNGSYSFSSYFNHVNNSLLMTITPTIIGVSGNNAIVDWMFIELRDGNTGATTVTQTRAALLQADGDIVASDGVSPVKFTAPAGNYYLSIRHRNHLGFCTANRISFSSTTVTNLDFTNNSVPLYGATPLYSISPTVWSMVGGDSNTDGSIDAFDSIVWETSNGLFDTYETNADHNLDGSVDAFDTIIWDVNNGKYQECP